VNTIGPKVNLTPGSISTAVDRLVERGLVSRVESPEDRRIRVVSLTPKGKELIGPIFRKHAAEIKNVFADASLKELRSLEATLKKIGKRAESMSSRGDPSTLLPRLHTGVVRRYIVKALCGFDTSAVPGRPKFPRPSSLATAMGIL